MKKDLKHIRQILIVFISLLFLSGITAFPLRTEMDFLIQYLRFFPSYFQLWIIEVYNSLNKTPELVLYGTDWLAFAHIIIALFFIGVYKDPIRNKFNVLAGMIACAGVFPLAFIMGSIRGIPFFHQLIDCSFGLLGMIPLMLIYKKINRLENEKH